MKDAQQKIKFENNHGIVNIHSNREPEQSKDVVKNVRFPPKEADDLSEVCFQNDVNFSEFSRKMAEVGKKYFRHADTLLREEKFLIPLLERLSKKF